MMTKAPTCLQFVLTQIQSTHVNSCQLLQSHAHELISTATSSTAGFGQMEVRGDDENGTVMHGGTGSLAMSCERSDLVDTRFS